MPLCGGFRCGCGVTSSPATEGAINGYLPTIDVSGSGEPGDPYDLKLDENWAEQVADAINVDLAGALSDIAALLGDVATLIADVATLDLTKAGFETGTFSPTLTNINIGTGGSALNSAIYHYVGGPNIGDSGLLTVTGRITLGTSGQSVGTGPQATIPPGFSIPAPVQTGANRYGVATLLTNANIGFVQQAGATAVAFVVGGAGSTYVTGTTITSAVPGTWGAGDALTYTYTIPVVRV